MNSGALTGCGILVTRPALQAEELAAAIEDAGGTPIRFPVIEIIARDHDVVATEYARLPQPDIVIFVSRNAATFGGAIPGMSDAHIAAIGPATKAAAEAWGAHVQIIPEQGFDSEHLLAHPMLKTVTGKNITVVRGEHGRELLGDELTRRGAEVSYLSAYRRQIRCADEAEIKAIDELWQNGGIRFVTVMSVGTMKNLLQLLPPSSIALLQQTRLVAPGARVIQTALKLLPGMPTITASGPGTEEILAALIEANTAENPLEQEEDHRNR